MREYTASEARDRFAEILKLVERGEGVAITRPGVPVAAVTPLKKKRIPAPGWGLEEGWSITMSDDFDSIPPGFEEYM
jgi:prevent-host-death family protein